MNVCPELVAGENVQLQNIKWRMESKSRHDFYVVCVRVSVSVHLRMRNRNRIYEANGFLWFCSFSFLKQMC